MSRLIDSFIDGDLLLRDHRIALRDVMEYTLSTSTSSRARSSSHQKSSNHPVVVQPQTRVLRVPSSRRCPLCAATAGGSGGHHTATGQRKCRAQTRASIFDSAHYGLPVALLCGRPNSRRGSHLIGRLGWTRILEWRYMVGQEAPERHTLLTTLCEVTSTPQRLNRPASRQHSGNAARVQVARTRTSS